MSEFPDVLASLGFWVAADVDAYQPVAGSATNNLADFADQIPSSDAKCGARVAHTAVA